MEKLVIPITSEIKDEIYKMANAQFTNFKNIRIKNGQSVFKMNIESLEITSANVDVKKQKTEKGVTFREYKVEHQGGHIYIVALNIKNATKKFINVIYTAGLYANINTKQSTSSFIEGDGKEPEEIKPNTP